MGISGDAYSCCCSAQELCQLKNGPRPRFLENPPEAGHYRAGKSSSLHEWATACLPAGLPALQMVCRMLGTGLCAAQPLDACMGEGCDEARADAQASRDNGTGEGDTLVDSAFAPVDPDMGLLVP